MEHAIEIHALTKVFSELKALKGIDLTVPKGSVYGFLGPNGAGKTTAIKIILGLTSATSGSVHVFGEEVRCGANASYLKQVGYLPQDPVFPEGLTGLETLRLVGDLYKVERAKADRHIKRWLEVFQLDKDANRKVTVYSRGMKQRLGLAAVLLTEPDLLILDEPVSALDPEGRRTVLELITGLRGKATVFFSSHILADVERVCDRITIIDQGLKLLESSTAIIMDQYAMEQYQVSVAPSHTEKARTLLEKHEAIRQVIPEGESMLITSEPGRAEELSEIILPLMVHNGIIVKEFARHRVNLEEVFFKIIQDNNKSEVSVS